MVSAQLKYQLAVPGDASPLFTLRAYLTDTAQRKGVALADDGAGGYGQT
jgi:hypothetical protein